MPLRVGVRTLCGLRGRFRLTPTEKELAWMLWLVAPERLRLIEFRLLFFVCAYKKEPEEEQCSALGPNSRAENLLDSWTQDHARC